jgi:hypothetical protein
MHAFLFDNGYSVRVTLEDGRTAGFGHLAFASEAWTEARRWAAESGATTLEERDEGRGFDCE